MAQRQRQPEPERPAARVRTTKTEEPQPAPEEGGGPPREPPEPTPQPGEWVTERSWLAWELGRAAREARASRNRMLGGLALLLGLAVAVVATGVFVDEAAFWVATGPAIGFLLTTLGVYGAIRLGVFAETAAVLGRRSEGGATAAGALGESERKKAEDAMRTQAYFEVGLDLAYPDPADRTSRDRVMAAIEAFGKAAARGHAEGARRCALLILASEGEDSKAARKEAFPLLLRACKKGNANAAYNLGALHARQAFGGRSERESLLERAIQYGCEPAAFMVGVIDASEEAVHALELPETGEILIC